MDSAVATPLDPGDPQEGGEYQSGFEEAYRHVDPAATAVRSTTPYTVQS